MLLTAGEQNYHGCHSQGFKSCRASGSGWLFPCPGEGKRGVLSPNRLLEVGGVCLLGGSILLLQDSTACFKADIRALVNGPSACPLDP